MANIDQTGCSDEFNSSFGYTNSSEFTSPPKPKSKSLERSTINSEPEPIDEIMMDVPFATPPRPSTSQTGQSVSRGKDLSLLLKPGEKYLTPQELLYFRENMTHSKMTPRKDRKTQNGRKAPRKQFVTKNLLKSGAKNPHHWWPLVLCKRLLKPT